MAIKQTSQSSIGRDDSFSDITGLLFVFLEVLMRSNHHSTRVGAGSLSDLRLTSTYSHWRFPTHISDPNTCGVRY